MCGYSASECQRAPRRFGLDLSPANAVALRRGGGRGSQYVRHGRMVGVTCTGDDHFVSVWLFACNVCPWGALTHNLFEM